jgi:hypothetical protein
MANFFRVVRDILYCHLVQVTLTHIPFVSVLPLRRKMRKENVSMERITVFLVFVLIYIKKIFTSGISPMDSRLLFTLRFSAAQESKIESIAMKRRLFVQSIDFDF